MDQSAKADGAFRTIGELSEELGLPQHILRYWETRFPKLRPLQRAGNRRYYRPADVALVKRIDQLLNREGYTIKGVQKLLTAGDDGPASTGPAVTAAGLGDDAIRAIAAIRDRLARALVEDEIAARI